MVWLKRKLLLIRFVVAFYVDYIGRRSSQLLEFLVEEKCTTIEELATDVKMNGNKN